MRWTRLALTVAAFAALLAANAAAAEAPPIGINLVNLTSHSADIPFVDVFKMSSPWRPMQANAVGLLQPAPLDLDENGWVRRLEPGQAAFTRIFNGGTSHYPAGVYTLFYDGEGRIDVAGAGLSIVENKPGLIRIRAVPTAGKYSGFVLIERETDATNPLRNIRLILPGFETRYLKDPFNPTFLARLAPFKTIRFMDWDSVLRSTASNWSDRRTPDYETQALPDCCVYHRMTGVALEYQIDVANRLNADAWFSVPALATDDYVARMAAMVRDRLRPNLKVYIEYGNEMWNPTFAGNYDHITRLGLAMRLAWDPKTAGRYAYAMRSAQVFAIWKRVFGAQSARVRRVIAGHLIDATFDDQVFPYMKAHGWSADVYAVADYLTPPELQSWKPVGPEFYDAILAMKPDEIVARLDEAVYKVNRPAILRHAAAARRYGMTLAAYEGGQGVSVQGMDPKYFRTYRDRLGAAFTAANRRPGMAKVYKDLLDSWFASGGGLFIHQGFIQEPAWYGSWGLLEYQDQDPATAVKYKAVVDYIGAGAGRR